MVLICDGAVTKNIDKYCIEKIGIPEIVLMENAARAATDRIINLSNVKAIKMDKIVFFCGIGNNGGDGFAMARYFYNLGKDIKIIVLGNKEKMTVSSKINYEILENIGIEIIFISENDLFEINNIILDETKNRDMIIDCIFGVGLNREINGYIKTVITSINEVKEMHCDNIKIISIDSPSGFNSTNGNVMSVSIAADYTITFEFFKKGFLRYGAERYTGEIFTEKIGVPKDAVYDKGDYAEFIDHKFVLDNLKKFENYVHKGDMGKVCIFAGSKGYTGAAYISTRACSRTGSGLTTLICDKEIQDILSIKLDEEMTCSLDNWERVSSLLEKSDAIAFGPGIGVSEHKQKLLDFLLDKYENTKVIDADGLSMIDYKWLHKKSNSILTPHIGEFSRMINKSIDEIESNRFNLAKQFAKEYEVVLVLKGKNTIVTDGERVMINTTGNKGMANGGMGDALTGIILSLCGQGYDNFMASCIAVYIHGLCGDKIFDKKNTVNATELIKYIPNIMKILYN